MLHNEGLEYNIKPNFYGKTHASLLRKLADYIKISFRKLGLAGSLIL